MATSELSFRLEHPAHTLWDAWFFDDEFQSGINEVFKISTFDITLDKQGEWPDVRISRQLHFDTDRNIPKALLAVVRGVTQVYETATLSGEARTLDVSLRLPIIGSRVDFGYQYSWRNVEGGCEVDWRGHCHVRLPLIRKLAEGYLMKELEDSTTDGVAFARSWFSR